MGRFFSFLRWNTSIPSFSPKVSARLAAALTEVPPFPTMENRIGLLSFVGPRTDHYLTGGYKPYQLPWKWVTRGYKPYKTYVWVIFYPHWQLGSGAKTLWKWLIIYIYIKPYTETTCLFGKCIRNSQKDCQFWTSSGFVRHQCPLGGEIFFWWDFVGLFFFFLDVAK